MVVTKHWKSLQSVLKSILFPLHNQISTPAVYSSETVHYLDHFLSVFERVHGRLGEHDLALVGVNVHLLRPKCVVLHNRTTRSINHSRTIYYTINQSSRQKHSLTISSNSQQKLFIIVLPVTYFENKIKNTKSRLFSCNNSVVEKMLNFLTF